MSTQSDDKLVCIERTLYLAFAAAWADGSLDPAEMSVIGEWVARKHAEFPAYQSEQVKHRINGTMREAYAAAKNGDAIVLGQAAALARGAQGESRYEALALCIKVIQADGVVIQKEIDLITRIGNDLRLDASVATTLLGMLPSRAAVAKPPSGMTDEVYLGLEAHVGLPSMCQAIRKEFDDISSQLEIETDREKREHYKSLLTKLTRLRQKHGCS